MRWRSSRRCAGENLGMSSPHFRGVHRSKRWTERAQRSNRFHLKERRLEEESSARAARAEAGTQEKRKQVLVEKWRE